LSEAVTSPPADVPEAPSPRSGLRHRAGDARGKTRPILALAWLLITAGCGPSTDAPPTNPGGDSRLPGPPPAAAAAESSPAASEAGAGETIDEADLPAVLAGLTQAARRYGLEQRKAPANLQELVAKGYLDHLPEPPGGGRFVIDKQLQVRLEK
jgi:hypothetical protein